MSTSDASKIKSDLFDDQGEVAEFLRHLDWSQTAVGPVEDWPASLRSMVQMILACRFPMYVVWGPERTFIYNDAYIPLIGPLRHPSSLGQTFSKAWPEIWPELKPMMESIDQGESTYLEDHLLKLQRKGTSEDAYFTFSFSPLRNDSNKVEGILCACYETTKRVTSESLAREAKINFERDVDASPAILWITNKDGYCTYLSQKWYEFTGQTAETALGYGWLKAVHPEDSELTGKIFTESNAGQVPFYFEYRLRDRNGDYHWAIDAGNPRFNAAGEYIGYAGSVISIHERKLAEAELARERHTLESFFTYSPAAMALWLGKDLVFERANTKFQKIFGSRKLVGLPLTEALIEMKDQVLPTLARQVLDTGIPYTGREVMILIGPGQNNSAVEHFFDFSLIRVNDVNGNAYGVYLHAVDVTDRKRASDNLVKSEEEATAAKFEAERANQLKSAFLANMSHEIRTPLGAMMGFADLLRDPGLSAEERSNYIDILYRNGESLSVIINDILDLSKVEAGHLTLEYGDTNPRDIAADVVSLLRVKAREKELVLEYEIDESTPAQITTDPTRLRQILVNLVGNAIKFTPIGKVKLRLYGCLNDLGRESLCVEIVDTGIGIPQDHLNRIFEMFVQGDGTMTRRFGGTGLGLALSRRLARAMGGDVSILESKLGSGTTFLLKVEDMPQNKTAEVMGKEVLRKSGPDSSAQFDNEALAGVKVLVVDDSADNRQLIWHYLSRHGATIETAENGLTGYRAAMNSDVDIVLMDIQMPIMDGYTATAKLRESGFQKPIIALTAHAMSDVRKKALSVGCTDHLPKPINPNELVSRISEYTQ